MGKDLVSIIVISYNSDDFIIETLDSIKNQTYENIELIVSDDCSKDNTVEVASNWLKINSNRFVNTELVVAKENSGIPANCNQGIRSADGMWIKLIAADDVLLPEFTSLMIKHANQNPNIAVLHCNVGKYLDTFENSSFIGPGVSETLQLNKPECDAKCQFEVLLRVNRVWAPTLMIKRNVFDKVGLYDEQNHLWEDTPMLIKITQNGVKLHYIDIIGAKYRVHSKSVKEIRSNKRLISNLSLEMASYYLKYYLKYMPFLERLIRKYLLYKMLVLEKSGLNKDNMFIKFLFKISGFPFTVFLKKYNQKYL